MKADPDLPGLVVPKVAWFYGNSLYAWVPIEMSGHTYVGLLGWKQHGMASVPPGWKARSLNQSSNTNHSSKNRSGYYHCGGDPITDSAYPIPVALTPISRVVAARYLFCRTKRGYFHCSSVMPDGVVTALEDRYHARIFNGDKRWIGALNLNLLSMHDNRSLDRPCALVVLSAGRDVRRVGSIFRVCTPLPGSDVLIQ